MDWDARAHLQQRACKHTLRWEEEKRKKKPANVPQNNTSDCRLLGCKWLIYREYPPQSLYGCISEPPCSSAEGSVTEIWNRGQRATQQIGFFFFFFLKTHHPVSPLPVWIRGKIQAASEAAHRRGEWDVLLSIKTGFMYILCLGGILLIQETSRNG